MLYGTFNDTHVEQQHYAWYGTSDAATSSGGSVADAGGGGGGGGSTTGNSYLYPEIRSLR